MIPPARSSCATLPDRRCATATLVAALTSGLAGVREPRLVRERFEEELRALLSASSVTFREDGEPIDRPYLVSYEVPVAPVDGRPCLEAIFDPSRPADEHARLMLAAAAQLAGLIIELERASGRWPLSRGRADKAAPLIGSSAEIRVVRDRIEKVAATDFTVLIEGESGTGKELVARQIHELSRRRRAPFVAVNCAAIVETLLEAELFGIEDRTATGVRGRRGKFEHAARRHALSRRSVRPVGRRAGQAAARDSGPVGGAGRRLSARGASTPASSWRRTGRCWISSSRSAFAWTCSTV